jgi:hypothetical protein
VPTTHPIQPTRLPTQSRGRKRGGELLRGLLGLVATLVVVVGPPVGLVVLVGNPLPDEAPNSDWLTAEISSDTLLEILAIVLWLAWLHFVICLVVELASDRRGRGLAPHVPGGGVGTQALARRLAGAVLLLAGTTAATLPAATASAERAPDNAATAGEAGTAPVGSSGGATASALRATNGVVKYYEVQPASGRHYDTLWDIAERFLGSGLRYKEIFELNHGVLQPDGRKLTNVDLIQPGWLLQLPADADGEGLKIVDHRVSQDTPTSTEAVEPDRDVAEDTSGHAESGDDDSTQAVRQAEPEREQVDQPEREHADEPEREQVDEADEQAARDSGPEEWAPRYDESESESTMVIDEPLTATDDAGEDESAAPSHDDVWTPTFGIAGGLLAAGLLAGIRRRRLAGSQLFLRVPSPDGGPTGPKGLTIADHESALRWESDPTSAALLSRGLRVWPPALYGGPVPQPSHCVVTPAGLSAVFGTAPTVAAPAPWQTSGDGRVWTLRTDDYRRLHGSAPALVPYPALVAFGRQTDDSLLFMDLEAFAGAVSIGGDVDVARAIAMSWAVDMAVHAWADERRIWLTGFADAPVELSSSMRVVDDIDRALESLERVAERQRAECQRLGVESVAAGRVAQPDARMWSSDLVVSSGAPSPATLDRLQELAAHPQHAISVIIVGDTPKAAARLAASQDGRLWSGPLGIDVVAQQLSVEAYRGMVDVFGEADRPEADPADEGLGVLMAPDGLDASVFDPRSRQAVEIGILGPVAVEADGPVDERRRGLLTELVIYVALHPEGVHPNALTAALWPRGVSDDVVDSTLAAAQTWLGDDQTGEPRLAMADGRWSIRRSGVRFDWDVFKALVNAPEQQDADDMSSLRQALELIRGEPWSELPARSYGWLAYDTIDEDVRVAIVLAARRLARACADRGDGRGARDAIVRGLWIAPAAEDLWRDALRLAAQLGSRRDVQSVADEMYTAIDEHGSPTGATAETDALVEELIPGYRPHSAA